VPLSLAMLWHGKLQLPSKGPGTARVFHFCVADLPTLRAVGASQIRQAVRASHRAQKRLPAFRSVA